jgi:glucose-6-phosphate 1-dehydrogenase
MTERQLRDSLMKGPAPFATRPVDDAIAQRLLHASPVSRLDPKEPESFDAMSRQLDALEAARQTGGNRLFYLATRPNAFLPISRELGRTGMLAENGAWRRLVVEKPFGTDLASAKGAERMRLPQARRRAPDLTGSTTISARRRCRTFWCCASPTACSSRSGTQPIDHIQITVDEKLGVRPARQLLRRNRRAARHGAEPSVPTAVAGHDGAAGEIRRPFGALRKGRSAFRDPDPGRARGAAQFRTRPISSGKIGDTEIEDYRKTPDVKPDSTTETYAALKLTIDNWRWAGVPFYLRTGKALGVKRTEIAIKFKQAPFAMFRDTPVDRLSQNYLIISTEPTEGIALQFNTKVPGPNINIDGVEMKFRYKDYFKAEPFLPAMRR